jgi:hypothetical protein
MTPPVETNHPDKIYVVSRSGVRHIVRCWSASAPIRLHAGRISTLCDFGIKPEDALPDSAATCDCQFCLSEAASQDQPASQMTKEQGTTLRKE